MRDGTTKEFPHETRPGGSYSNSIRNEHNFVVIVNVWGNETWIPVVDIKAIQVWDR